MDIDTSHCFRCDYIRMCADLGYDCEREECKDFGDCLSCYYNGSPGCPKKAAQSSDTKSEHQTEAYNVELTRKELSMLYRAMIALMAKADKDETSGENPEELIALYNRIAGIIAK